MSDSDRTDQRGAPPPGAATRSGEPGPGDRGPEVQDELERLRASIDNIDAAVVYMLAERFKCTQRVGRLKAEHQLPPADPARESRQIARLRELATEARLDPAFAEKLLNFVIAEVIRHHETIARES
ncbi:chorismate mutase [Streptomyces bohaiensis]|uniref:Chorismate mutase n=1 Tax=Streptomyces bohaiensis TaxID=1431344 RepID=A0ABX1CFB7_9ACTN|nr:chorismate mutase [Streptomyces bohaiensis]NJQ16863.1 chorismate mutase [Streptomyces bohaiensis]